MRIVSKMFLHAALMLFASCTYGNTWQIAEGLQEAKDTINYHFLGEIRGNSILIRDTVDLDNSACMLPEGVLLNFEGGYIKNGTLIGNRTRLKSIGTCFNRVRIRGSWNIPDISTCLFEDLTYDNALKDVMSLADSKVKNKIYIAKGRYQVTAYKNGDVCIPVCSNTDFVFDGEMNLVPNDFRNYYIVKATGNNITIRGKGTITGDKLLHTGESGEWGMGVFLDNAHQVRVSGLTIKDCWGDCIYVGNESTKIRIENCVLDNGRRQGISITSAKGVVVRNCVIKNVGGTAPEYAIDLEPNKGETVENIIIDNVTVNKCRGGFFVYGKAPNSIIKKVKIVNCTIKDVPKIPIKIQRCESIVVKNCKAISCKRKDPVFQEEIKGGIVRGILVQ